MKNSLPKSNFRKDINGLRAWAVIAVVLFHFGVPGFGGGFVGVDVFFVISGYLMTGIIISGLENKGSSGFSIWDFYLARAKRILPALLVLCAILMVVGWFYLASPDYRALGWHSFFSVDFLSNVQFWREAGYFDSASHEKWLLHTWSLSVEWQFYVVLPIVLAVAWRFFPGRSNAAYVVAAGFVSSLLLAVLLTPSQPSAAFFLLPARAWEMLAGGLVYLFADRWVATHRMRSIVELCGFVLIVGSVASLGAQSSWPGYLALLPVSGTVLVLLAGRQTSLWTSSPVAQSLGAWSYSIYLWHWPVHVGLVYLDLQKQTAYIVGGIGLSLVLGWASYRLVENPARFALGRLQTWRPWAAIGFSVTAVALSGLYVRFHQGMPGRFAAPIELAAQEAFNIASRRTQCHSMAGDPFRGCVYGGPNIKAVLVGDSHASSVVSAIQAALGDDKAGVLAFSYTSCPTLFGVKMAQIATKCAEFNEWVVSQLEKISPTIPLIIVNRTSAEVFGDDNPEKANYNKPVVYFEKKYETPSKEFLAEFRANLISSTCSFATKRSVYLVRPIPEMPVDVPKELSRKLIRGKSSAITISAATYQQRHAFVWAAQDSVKHHCSVNILDPVPWLCPDGQCKGTDNGRPLYYDDHHLSEFGNKFLVPMFAPLFEKKLVAQ